MVRITLMDGSTQELSRDGILGVYPCEHLFRHPQLKSDAVIYKNGRLLPVLGPLPEGKRAWILLFETHGQVIRELPAFDDDVSANSATEESAETEEDFFLKVA
jgi:hypothetical protein